MSHGIERLTALPARAISSFSKSPGQDVQCEGWLLKKRRRKYQGFADRYFILRSSGVLSYALHPHLTPRGQITLNSATISSNSSRREIHIDSENGIYHVKAISASDFEMWMTAFRKFIHVSAEGGTLNKKYPSIRTVNLHRGLHVNKINIILEEMSLTIKEIDVAVRSAKNGDQNKRQSSHPKPSKDGRDREVFKNIFRRSTSHSPSDVAAELPNTETPQTTGLDHVQVSIEALKSQLDKLRQVITQAESIVSPTLNSSIVGPSSLFMPTNRPRSESMGTSMSEDVSTGSIWYDATEGPEEVVLPDDTIPTLEMPEADIFSSNDSAEAVTNLIDDEMGDGRDDSDHTQQHHDDTQVVRRTILPAPVSGDEVSLFALLRKNIGKDLSTVSFPVTSNEPLGLLQRIAEDVEYSDLLSRVCLTADPIDRMCLVAAFAVSGFACTRLRSGRKPFTPMLGETFEDIRTKFIAEKVSNHPLVVACHAEGNGWELWGTNAGKNHFWGKSLEIEPTGATHLQVGKDHFQWFKPSSFVRNLVMGTKYLEHVGSLTIENITTGARCVIDFQEAGYWGTPNVLVGTVYSPDGRVETRLQGAWHEQLSQVLSESHLKVLWRANAFPKHAPEYYGLTSFATTLNEITKDIEGKLPPTDTRYRPDLRALEEGNVELAEMEKARVENAQRERRSKGTEVEPRWFKKVGPVEYTYNGGYWEQRSKSWSGFQSLW